MSFHKNVRVNLRLKKIAFAKRPVEEKSKFQNTQGSESKTLMLRRGRCFALCVRASTPSSTSILSNCPTLLYFV